MNQNPKQKNREIERKFLVLEENKPDTSKMWYMDIIQGYVPDFNCQYIYRLRQVLYMAKEGVLLGEEYFQTIKGRGLSDREEYESPIWKNTFSVFWPLCEKNTVHKYRYEIPKPKEVKCKEIFFDVYKNELSGFYTVEVEFDSIEDCNNFVPLEWFGKELTKDRRFTNFSLAINGMPQD